MIRVVVDSDGVPELDVPRIICDVCGEVVTEHGFVVAKPSDGEMDVLFIHQSRCDPGHEAGYTLSWDLEQFLGYLRAGLRDRVPA